MAFFCGGGVWLEQNLWPPCLKGAPPKGGGGLIKKKIRFLSIQGGVFYAFRYLQYSGGGGV